MLAPFPIAAAIAKPRLPPGAHCARHRARRERDELDLRLLLERATFRPGDLNASERAEMRKAIDRLDVGTIVISTQAKGNRRMRSNIVKLGFEQARTLGGFSVLVRQPAQAAEQN